MARVTLAEGALLSEIYLQGGYADPLYTEWMKVDHFYLLI